VFDPVEPASDAVEELVVEDESVELVRILEQRGVAGQEYFVELADGRNLWLDSVHVPDALIESWTAAERVRRMQDRDAFFRQQNRAEEVYCEWCESGPFRSQRGLKQHCRLRGCGSNNEGE